MSLIFQFPGLIYLLLPLTFSALLLLIRSIIVEETDLLVVEIMLPAINPPVDSLLPGE